MPTTSPKEDDSNRSPFSVSGCCRFTPLIVTPQQGSYPYISKAFSPNGLYLKNSPHSKTKLRMEFELSPAKSTKLKNTERCFLILWRWSEPTAWLACGSERSERCSVSRRNHEAGSRNFSVATEKYS